MTAKIGTTIEPRWVWHKSGDPLVEVSGTTGCYVSIRPTEFMAGEGATRHPIPLTPDEARDLAYKLRLMADLVDKVRIPGNMR